MQKLISIIVHEIRFQKTLIITWIAIWSLLAIFTLAFFDNVVEQADKLFQVLDSFPKEFIQVFAADARSILELGGFYNSRIMTLLSLSGIILGVNLGAGMLGRQLENGALIFLVSKPISRWLVYMAKFMAGCGIILIMNGLIMTISLIAAYTLTSVDPVPVNYFLIGFAVMSLLHITALALGQALGIIFNPGVALMTGVVMAVVGMVMDGVAGVAGTPKFIEYFSPYFYADYGIIAREQVFPATALIFIPLILILFGVGMRWFEQKDLPL